MPPLTTPLDQLTLAFLDVETTGLYPQDGDRVCEIAVVRTRAHVFEATFATLVNPERPISPDAARVNGLRDDDLAAAPRFAEIAATVLFTLRDAVIVCHNAPFDMSFLLAEMQYANCRFDAPPVIDTLAIARRCYNFGSNSLPNVARRLGVETPNAHRALGDVMTTRGVYLRFKEDLQARGARTLGDLVKYSQQ